MSHAAVLARWTPVAVAEPGGDNYDSSTDTPPADEVAANLTVSPLDRIGLEGFGNGGAVWSGRAAPETTVIDLAIYTTFTITPDAGFLIDLENVSYDYQSYGVAAAGYTFFARSSVDGFASDLDTATSSTATGKVILDLSALTDLSGPTEVRFYAISPNAGNNWLDLIGNNTATDVGYFVNGTVSPIPEPSSLLLSGLAILGLARRRRA